MHVPPKQQCPIGPVVGAATAVALLHALATKGYIERDESRFNALLGLLISYRIPLFPIFPIHECSYGNLNKRS